ncbi:MAG TPA: hypothetical protein VF167_16640 [Longimicrobiaceae bacterium]
MSRHRKSDFEIARDELMSHIHRCGVLKALPEHQVEWMDDTIEYLGECYPSLTDAQLAELKQIGLRFCAPVIPHGDGYSALTVTESEYGNGVQQGESDASDSLQMASV